MKIEEFKAAFAAYVAESDRLGARARQLGCEAKLAQAEYAQYEDANEAFRYLMYALGEAGVTL